MADDAEIGTLTFVRGRTWQGFFSSYDIIVDGQALGRLARSSELTVNLPPGPHTCQVKVSWTGSPIAEVQVRAGHSTRVNILPDDQGSLYDRALSEDGFLRLEVEP